MMEKQLCKGHFYETLNEKATAIWSRKQQTNKTIEAKGGGGGETFDHHLMRIEVCCRVRTLKISHIYHGL